MGKRRWWEIRISNRGRKKKERKSGMVDFPLPHLIIGVYLSWSKSIQIGQIHLGDFGIIWFGRWSGKFMSSCSPMHVNSVGYPCFAFFGASFGMQIASNSRFPSLPSFSLLNYHPLSPGWSGWWLSHPSEKYEFVSWDYDIPNIWKVI